MARPIEHGLSGTPTYRSWANMKARCNNAAAPNYSSYGGRGITHTERWLNFKNFLNDMGVRPDGKTLDRIDVNGPYTKDNCRWATGTEQQRNKRPFAQPDGRTYGEGTCRDCGVGFIKMSNRSTRCAPCTTYARRYFK